MPAMTTLTHPDSPALAQALPRHVAWLGYGGLLPFVGLAALAGFDPHHLLAWSDALVGYGAVILSFIGALHWGVAMSAPASTRHAVVGPSCGAWCRRCSPGRQPCSPAVSRR
jgi:hypothetical protein